MCSWVVELYVSMFNWCLKLPVCDSECGMNLDEDAFIEQMRNPGIFA